MLDVTTAPLDTVLSNIFEAFRPKPVKCQLNGKWYFIERTGHGWAWRNEDGDLQEDYGITPFETAAQCQQSACWFAGERRVV